MSTGTAPRVASIMGRVQVGRSVSHRVYGIESAQFTVGSKGMSRAANRKLLLLKDFRLRLVES